MPANRFLVTMFFSDRPRTLPALLRGPFSQTELATAIDTDPTTINDWENGRTFPQARFLRALIKHASDWAATMGIKLTDILDPENLEKPEQTK